MSFCVVGREEKEELMERSILRCLLGLYRRIMWFGNLIAMNIGYRYSKVRLYMLGGIHDSKFLFYSNYNL